MQRGLSPLSLLFSRLKRPSALIHFSLGFPLSDPSPSSWPPLDANSFMSFPYHGAQKSHTGLKVRPHLQTYLSKGKRKEPGKPHTAHCWQTLKICPRCKNTNCKHPQPLSFHSFVYLGEEPDAQRPGDLIFSFLQLERPIQFYQTTLLSQELFGSLGFITEHCVLKS